MVDKRIMAKLLVTYFERGCARDVLALMARMLNMEEDDVHKVCVWLGPPRSRA